LIFYFKHFHCLVFFILGTSVHYPQLKTIMEGRVQIFWCQIFLKAFMLAIWIAKCVLILYCAQTYPIHLISLHILDEIVDVIVMSILWWFYYAHPVLAVVGIIFAFGLKCFNFMLHILFRDDFMTWVYGILIPVNHLMNSCILIPDPPPANSPREYGDALPPA